MEKFVIYGGNRLSGEVEVSGAKNAVLPLMAGALLTRGTTVLHNVPDLRDVRTMNKLLQEMGAEVEFSNGVLQIDTSKVRHFEAPYELVRTMRASVVVLGPLLARYGRAKVSLPGGCAIGSRPIDLHLMGLEKLGAKLDLSGGYIVAKAPKLKGTYIQFDFPTVTGTANVMMAAALAEGRTVIENAAREPEVVELANFINKMGGKISGAGTDVLIIHGVEELKPVEYRVIPDRIEAGTLMAAAIITDGDVIIKNCPLELMTAVVDKFTAAGATIEKLDDTTVRVYREGPILPVDVRTQPYPGFPTDMQAQHTALMTLSTGRAAISETIFENRFMHVSELRRMGADIICEGSIAFVTGKKRLQGAPVMATDLRASASLVLAGLAADGITEIDRIYHLDRGYDRIELKLQALGAKIKRVKK